MSRRFAREQIFKFLFESDLGEIDLVENLDGFLEREENEKLNSPQLDYIKDTLNGVYENKSKIDSMISETMENWNIERIGTVERNLLRFATYEILFTEIGHEIVVNEAVELAKKYGDEKSHEFINGVLAKIIKKL